MVQVLCLFENFSEAKRILSFFRDRAIQSGGAFFNAYDARSGQPWEHKVHTGPNLWLGMACLHYQERSGDRAFENLALSLGKWALDLQAEDPERGLRGGPDVGWFSTEHNLDAYAFCLMLEQVKGENRYLEAADALSSWLSSYGWEPQTGRVYRGKNDHMIAMDVASWSISVMGPHRLVSLGLDPEKILAFAEEKCRVSVLYDHPDARRVSIRGFDFTDPRLLGRNPVVSSEWTAQAIGAFQVLSRYYAATGNEEKSSQYEGKANFFLSELRKLIHYDSPKDGVRSAFLPYATLPNVETGHGWKTPQGYETGSVAGTAFALFSFIHFNPFDLRPQSMRQ